MLTVVVGRTRFIGWDAIVGIDGEAMLAVKADPLRVTLNKPAVDPKGTRIVVVDNERRDVFDPLLRELNVIATERSVSIYLGSDELLHAVAIESDVVQWRVDLRRIGAGIWDDVDGFHVGQGVFRDSVVQGQGTAIMVSTKPMIPPAVREIPADAEGPDGTKSAFGLIAVRKGIDEKTLSQSDLAPGSFTFSAWMKRRRTCGSPTATPKRSRFCRWRIGGPERLLRCGRRRTASAHRSGSEPRTKARILATI
jgi:hypothetical protein